MFIREELAKIQVEIDKCEREYEDILDGQSEDIDDDLNQRVPLDIIDEKQRLKTLMKQIKKEKIEW